MTVTSGDELADAIQSGAVPADTYGACFRGKPIEEDAVYGQGHAKAGQPLSGARCRITVFSTATGLGDAWLDREVTATGRRCWSYAGRGFAYEVVDDNGNIAWISCDMEPLSY